MKVINRTILFVVVLASNNIFNVEAQSTGLKVADDVITGSDKLGSNLLRGSANPATGLADAGATAGLRGGKKPGSGGSVAGVGSYYIYKLANM